MDARARARARAARPARGRSRCGAPRRLRAQPALHRLARVRPRADRGGGRAARRARPRAARRASGPTRSPTCATFVEHGWPERPDAARRAGAEAGARAAQPGHVVALRLVARARARRRARRTRARRLVNHSAGRDRRADARERARRRSAASTSAAGQDATIALGDFRSTPGPHRVRLELGLGGVTSLVLDEQIDFQLNTEEEQMAKLRLGVIGAGSWAVASHLPNFAKRRDEVEFVGVCRKGPELLEKIKDDWGFQVASEDYQDVIDAGMDICLVGEPARPALRAREGRARGGRARALREAVHGRARATPGTSSRSPTAKSLHLLLELRLELPAVDARGEAADGRARDRRDRAVGRSQMASVTPRAAREPRRLPGRPRRSRSRSRRRGPTRRNGGGYAQAQLSHALGVALWLTGPARRGGVRADEGGPRRAGRASRRGRDPLRQRLDRDDVGRLEPPRRGRQPPRARGARDRLRGRVR